MPTITDLILDRLPTLVLESQLATKESRRIIAEAREKLLDAGWILRFDKLAPEVMNDKSLLCIDGGNTLTAYQNGDLIVTGASVGEGYYTKKLFNDETTPSEVFVGMPPHSSANQHLSSGMRALQELRLLATTKEADYRIIDGSYLANIGELLTRLVDENKHTVDLLLGQNFYDHDGLLQDALEELLHPSRTAMGRIIAVVKNDSNKEYADLFNNRWGIDVGTMTDRMIADRILEPGEFLTPRWLDSNGRLIGVLKDKIKREDYHKNVKNKVLLDKLVRDSIEPLETLRSQLYDPTLEGILWSTYFKPHAWSKHDKSIRIEYPFYVSNSDGINYRDFCAKMVQIIDQDVISPTILEPICQWEADKQAKKVSDATKIAESSIRAEMDNEDLYRMRSYRT
jgi:hypothetical protein